MVFPHSLQPKLQEIQAITPNLRFISIQQVNDEFQHPCIYKLILLLMFLCRQHFLLILVYFQAPLPYFIGNFRY